MDENEEVVEVSEELSDEEEGFFDDAWDDDATDFEVEDSEDGEPEADEADTEDVDAQTEDEPEDEEPEAEDQTSEQGTENETGNQRFKINYLGKEEELTLDQMTELAQKGRDYDHVREERDQLRAATSGSDKKLAFLEDLAKRSGLSVDEQIDRTRALWLQVDEADKGNEITESEALERIKKSNNQSKSDDADEGGKLTDSNIDRFLKVYPTVRAEDIPKEVWEMTKDLNGDLLGAYQAYEIKKLREENASGKKSQRKEDQNHKNENRSTGPRRTAGSNKGFDDFDEGWRSDV